MNTEIDERIRQYAYALWEAAGRPLGRDLDYWLQAEKEALDKKTAPAGMTASPGKKKTAKSTASGKGKTATAKKAKKATKHKTSSKKAS